MSRDKGRPAFLSENALNELREKVQISTFNMKVQEFKKLLIKMANEEGAKNGNVGNEVIDIPKTTFNRILDIIGFKKGQANATTKARGIACSDIRNVAAHTAMIGHINHIIS